MPTNRQWLLKQRPGEVIDNSLFEWREGPVPEPADGEVLVRNLFLSFDPTQRGWMTMDTYIPKIPLGDVMLAAGVGQVVTSRNPNFASGDLVQGAFGWQDYATASEASFLGLRKVPDGVPPNLALSLFGITGLTAYFGVLDVAAPKAGETFVVSGAAGATGSVAGMIAKQRGCRVIGIAGGEAKCQWLTKEARFDAAIDYKSEDIGERLSELCSSGIDCYFDNVGGEILDAVLMRINHGARIALCGAISRYGKMDQPGPGPSNYMQLIIRSSTMRGFLVLDYADRFGEAVADLARWHAEGVVIQEEDIAEGLENAPQTLERLFSGANLGKQLLKVADPA